MTKRMLIDASHPEETRVVVLDGDRLDDFDYESTFKKQLRGNIYLAKVTRVEPSLQAAFVEYGGNRQGFLAFNEIHPDYYQIPHEDRERLIAEERAAEAALLEESEDGDDEEMLEAQRRRRISMRKYKIQEVIKRRQIMLIQVVKEERGNKGAALTTYLSLAGRYCVLMPNTARGGGISRKITNAADRKRLRKIATELEIPQGMGLIIRTAGAKRTKTEIKRDFEYLLRVWENIRDTTMKSIAPALVHEEGSLVKRALRDLYDKDVEDILIDGEAAHREAKEFVRMLTPSQARKVQLHKGRVPLFIDQRIEDQLESIHSPVVHLRSGGSIVIHQTEALVAIDVNSGRSTKERSIEHTALRTNLEAAEEAARQMRLRDLAGLIVIDFIDMDEAKNDRQVEKRLGESLRLDRARVQMGKISAFGLVEISRQRRRTGIIEGSSHVCEHCQGSGRVRSIESSSLRALRSLENRLARFSEAEVELAASPEVAFYLLNEKRAYLNRLEERFSARIRVRAEPELHGAAFELSGEGAREHLLLPEEREPVAAQIVEPDVPEEFDDAAEAESTELDDVNAEGTGAPPSNRRRRRRRRGGGQNGGEAQARQTNGSDRVSDDAEDDSAEGEESSTGGNRNGESIRSASPDDGEGSERRRRRRRGRRGGRRRRTDENGVEINDAASADGQSYDNGSDDDGGDDDGPEGLEQTATPDVTVDAPIAEEAMGPAAARVRTRRAVAPVVVAAEAPAPVVVATPEASISESIEAAPEPVAEPLPAPVAEPAVVTQDTAAPTDPVADAAARERRENFLASRFKRWIPGAK